jgi:hypothetical protein
MGHVHGGSEESFDVAFLDGALIADDSDGAGERALGGAEEVSTDGTTDKRRCGGIHDRE